MVTFCIVFELNVRWTSDITQKHIKMRKFTAIICFFALCLAVPALGQNKTIAKANKLYKAKDYHGAIPLFEEGLAIEDNLQAKTKLANAYLRINQLDKAESIYATIVYDDKVRPETFKAYGETLMGNGKYAAAKFWFEEFLKKKPGDVSAKQNLASCNKVYNIQPQFYNVQVTPFPFNSKFDDNGVVQWKENLVFASDRASGLKILKQKISDDGREFINVYQSTPTAEGWSEPSNFSGKINLLNKNVGPITFNKAGDMAVFSRNADVANKSEEYSLQLYSAVYDGKKWKDIKVLSFCRPGNNYMHPALSPDGKLLFFASNKGGGEGKTDIYVSEKRSAAWSSPQNLGPTVNSTESEGFPFCAIDGKLYFCSKGRLGFGGFDIYVTEKDEAGAWSKPTNLGFPMNSSADDVSFYIDDANMNGFLSSSRQNMGDDIFTFQMSPDEIVEEDVAVTFAPKPKEQTVEKPKVKSPEPVVAEVNVPEITTPTAKVVEEKIPATQVVEEKVKTVVAEQEIPTVAVPKVDETKVVEKVAELVPEKKKKRKKKKEMNTINEKSDEAIAYVAKSDTTIMTRAELEAQRNMEIEKTATAAVEKVQEKAVLPGASLSGDTSAPPELLEVSTSGSMANSTTIETPAAEVPASAEQEFSLDTEQSLPEATQPSTELEVAEQVAVAEVKEVIEENNPVGKVAEPAVDRPVATSEVVPEVAQVVTTEVAPVVKTEVAKAEVKSNKKKAKKAKKNKKAVVNTTQVESTVAAAMGKVETMAEPVVKAPVAKISPAIVALSKDLLEGKASNKYELSDLSYGFNATSITPALGNSLDALLPLLKDNESVRIQLIGHTGSIGSNEKNQRLSVARAAAAVDYLIGKGVQPSRVTFDGRGESELLNECTDGILCSRDQHGENDRIEIRVLN